ILHALQTYQSDMYDVFQEGRQKYNTAEEVKFVSDAFVRCFNISIDFAIMEKDDNVYVLPADFGWSDLGTWTSVYDLSDKDYMGNAVTTPETVITYDTSNCMVHTVKDRLVILKGLHNFIVIQSHDALLICPKDEEQT